MGGNSMTENQVRKGKLYLDKIEVLTKKKQEWGQCTRYHEAYTVGWASASLFKLDISIIPFPMLRDMVIKMIDSEINTLRKELEEL